MSMKIEYLLSEQQPARVPVKLELVAHGGDVFLQANGYHMLRFREDSSIAAIRNPFLRHADDFPFKMKFGLVVINGYAVDTSVAY